MHAYLIMAHKNPHQLKILLKLLDHEENDIFLHIDKKSHKNMLMEDYSQYCKQSHVYIVPGMDVRWGHVSQIQCELYLLDTARKVRPYIYYHLISGMDLPLKSQQEIHAFFKYNEGKEFINFSGRSETAGRPIEDRVKYFWGSKWYSAIDFKYFAPFMKRMDKLQVKFQKLIGINRVKKIPYKKFYHGSNWFSITDHLAKAVLEKSKEFVDIYKCSLCCDEIFLQTFLMNDHSGEWFERLYRPYMGNGYEANMRLIDWHRGAPYTWRSMDYDELMNTEALFARKFDETIDKEIIDKISNKIYL